MEGIAQVEYGVKINWQSRRQFDGPWVFDRFGDDDYTYEAFVLKEQ